MTTKIIKRRDFTEHFHTYDCKKCGSTLRSTVGDGRLMIDVRDGDYYEFLCPVCSQVNTIDARLMRKP